MKKIITLLLLILILTSCKNEIRYKIHSEVKSKNNKVTVTTHLYTWNADDWIGVEIYSSDVNTTTDSIKWVRSEERKKAYDFFTILKDEVDFSTVMSVDIRPGTVSVAKRVPKSDKLIQLTISTNIGKKSVVTNLGDTYEPEEFVGKRFLFVMNMKPVKMMGVLSEAMILAGEEFKFNDDENSWEEKTELFILK